MSTTPSSGDAGRSAPTRSEPCERLRLAARVANVGIWDWDLQTNEVYYSPEWKRQIGHEEYEIGNDFAEWQSRVHPDDLDHALRCVRAVLDHRVPDYNVEFRLRHKDGSYRWVLANSALISDEDGNALRLLGTHVDITQRRRMEEALRESEELYRLIFANMSDTVVVADDEGCMRYICPNVAVIFRYSPEEVAALGTIDRLLGADLFDPAELERKKELWNIERIITDKHGVERCVLVHVKRVSICGATVLYTCRDITERRRSEIRIRHLNRVYAVLSDINETIVRDGDPQRLFEAACRIAVEKGGFRLAWVGLVNASTDNIKLVAHAGASAGTIERVKAILDDPEQDRAFASQSTRTGEHVICNNIALDAQAAAWRDIAREQGYRSMASLVLRSGGAMFGTFNLYAEEDGFFDEQEMRLLDQLTSDIGFAMQVHQHEEARRRAETASTESEERFRQLTEAIQDVFWMTDPAETEVLYVSPAYESIWGRSRESLYAAPQTWLETIHPDDRTRIQALHEALARQQATHHEEEYRIVRPDGKVRWIRDRIFPVLDPSARVKRVVGVARDVTEQRLLEEQFRQAQKMEAVGRLAGGVAHDFNNILSAILMQAALAAEGDDLPAGLRNDLEQISLYARRAADLTRQLLLFSRSQVIQLRDLNLNEIVTSVASMLQRIIGEDVRLELKLHQTPLLVRADAGMLDQVILNLAVNARDAMPKGGRLLIETASKTVDAEFARLHPDAAPGRYCWIGVSDTGSGIPPDVLPQIFEPFFTTKESGKGTGLGLATVYGIVKQHRGWIRVYSEPGQGTAFQIYLPAADAPAAKERAESAATPRGGTETILLAEDEESVRCLIRTILERHGYRVLEAANGDEALRQWQQYRSATLLVTDLVMPGALTGQQLARQLQADDSRLKVIFISGYSAELAGRELQLRPGENFLQKPFGPNQLLEAVRRSLDS